MKPSQELTVFEERGTAAGINRNNFSNKSLCSWAYNIAMGCIHGCSFCYVPEVATNKQEKNLEKKENLIPQEWIDEHKVGVHWADKYWGRYALLRPWDEEVFRKSLEEAVTQSKKMGQEGEVKKEGNRAIMFCTTTDPYQTFSVPGDPEKTKILNNLRQNLVRNALEIILNESDLNVRILTRSGLAIEDFKLYKRFGNRLLFGMSLPTLNDKLSRVYEPDSPGPTAKLKTLKAAKDAGLHVYVAMAPTMPDQDEAELRHTMEEIAKLEPFTIFHEAINIRAEMLYRIEQAAINEKTSVKSEVFLTGESWREYAFKRYEVMGKIAHDLGIPDGVFHQWPDPVLASKTSFLKMKLMQVQRYSDAERLSSGLLEDAEREWKGIEEWINYWHDDQNRISAWPGIRTPKWK